MLRWLALLLLAALAAPAMAADKDYDIVRINADTVLFDGVIGAQSARQLLAAIDERTRFLIITSQGGSASDAIPVGRELRRRNITLIVKEYCYSACANYLFLGAHSKILLNNALLGFHGAAGVGLDLEQRNALRSAATPAAAQASLSEQIDRIAREELDYFEEAHISYDLFVYANAQLKPVADQLASKPPQFEGQVVVRAGARAWTYPSAQLNAAFAKVAALEKTGIKARLDGHLRMQGKYSDMVYFPRRETLERFGVQGIAAYAYPADQATMKRLHQHHFAGAIVGDDPAGATP